jgi:uncharacterized membrane protein YdbT with pleckstrin-like domain
VVRPSSRAIRPLYTLSFLLIAIVYGWNNNREERMDWLIVFPLTLLACIAIADLLRRFEKLIIGGGKIRHESGILSRSSQIADLGRVQNVHVRQSVRQRLFGIGDLVVETAGEGPGIRMRGVDSPQQIANLILESANR